jgi:hypothetical protein
MASATCSRLAACSQIWDIKAAYGDPGTCTARQTVRFSSLLTASGAGWTPAALEACSQAIPALSCSDFLGHNLPATCHPAGQLANGASCADGTQCQSGYCLSNAMTTPTTGCGTCGPALTGAQSCNTASDCPWGSACLVPHGACGQLGAAGSTCLVADNCLWGLACIQGHCASPQPAGGPCTDNSECDYLGGFACSGATCAALPVASVGQLCGSIGNANVRTLCGASGFCNSSGTCQAAVSDGAACDPLTGPNCMPPAQCLGKMCTVLGASCR